MSGLDTLSQGQAPNHLDSRTTEKLAADSQSAQTKAIQDTAKQDSGANDSGWTKSQRVLETTGKGVLESGSGLVRAIKNDWDHPMDFVAKVGTGFATGAVMKTLLPSAGVGRAIAGTVMLGFAAWDVAKPLGHEVNVAWNSNDQAKLDQAAKGLGDGLGEFAWGSVVGMASGYAGEKFTGSALKNGLGASRYRAWEASKDKFYNCPDGFIGKRVQKVDQWSTWAKEKLNPGSTVTRLRGPEAIKAAGEASKNINNITPKNSIYMSRDFSPFMDELTSTGTHVPEILNIDRENRTLTFRLLRKDAFETPPGEGKAPAPGEHHDPADGDVRIRVPQSVDVSPDPPPHLGEGAETTPTPHTDDTLVAVPKTEQQVEGDKSTDAPVKVGGDPSRKTTAAEEFDAKNLAPLAKVAASKQSDWANTGEQDQKGLPNRAQIEDFKDSIKGPVTAVSGNPRLIQPQYDRGLQDVRNLAQQVQSAEDLAQAGALLQFHGQAANQVLMRNPLTIDLNNQAMELHSIFLQGLRDIGLTNLDGKVPSWVAVCNDQDSGNFTIAAIKNVISLPVTVFPRWQTDLAAMFAAINGHEMLGHDYIYPEIARFPKEYRSQVLDKAVKEAMSAHNIEDIDVKVGDTTLKKSELFAKKLEAEANENTADMMGTAATATGTPISLAVLLMSLRRGGQLETRNVYGKQFPNLFEPHGFDRWRVKLCAETIRHLADQDPRAMEIAKALDALADKASRPGDYILASMDNKGETVTFKQSEWDAIIPSIVKAQFETGLPSLRVPASKVPSGYVDKTVRTEAGEPRGYVDMTLRDIVGKRFMENLKNTDDLASQMTDAVMNGQQSLDKFDAATFKQQYGVNNIFNASLLAWTRATARGADAEKALEAISKISDSLRALYRESNPHVAPLDTPAMQAFKNAPLTTIKNGLFAAAGNTIGAQQNLRYWVDTRSSLIIPAEASVLAQDLMDKYKLTHQLVFDKPNP